MRRTPMIAWVGFGILSVQAVATLTAADAFRSTAGALVACPLVILGPALAAAGARLLLPWLHQSPVGVAVAVSQSATLWWAVMVQSGASPTSMLVTAMVLATGTVCIVAGFRVQATALRHYGLTLVMAVVMKLALLDLADGSSITQVLALLVAGLACFCLSLAYNRFAHEQARYAAETNPAPTDDHRVPPYT
ncbi:hypothetical protein CWT12_05260 [Actinomyces sp. 432]|uniref:hypothetical protein n=1 Tax=Actinomyces sp. 432 TaxID=2057798 RepID=UPI001374644A|nr:hypothetical protein [Actinomyces sp. 432]QHO90853.1 hypothetical protein CWT12_05260 [Actinomyces sp. 432]